MTLCNLLCDFAKWCPTIEVLIVFEGEDAIEKRFEFVAVVDEFLEKESSIPLDENVAEIEDDRDHGRVFCPSMNTPTRIFQLYDLGMQFDGYLSTDLRTVGAQATQLESEGYLGAFTAETSHDPFLPLVVAAQATDRLELGTSIAVAFARNPMTLAHTARDLNEFSGGRMILGLGSQIKPHITKRFSMPWSAPAARMREIIGAMDAIWDSWDTGEPLRFKGDHYTYILLTDFFNPGPARHGKPEVYLAAVGPLMVRLTAEICQGWMVHPFTTPQHFSNVALPRMRGFMDEAGRTHDSVKVALPAFVVTGDNEGEMSRAALGIKQQIGFYGSTPAYRDVLDFHGWGDAQTELNTLTKSGRWNELADVIDDEMLATFAVVAEPENVELELEARYGGLVDRISRYTAPL